MGLQTALAPDAATKDGKFYLFFPARDKEGIFRIGVAVGDKPEGPFTPQPEYIPGTFSIDPASFVDDGCSGSKGYNITSNTIPYIVIDSNSNTTSSFRTVDGVEYRKE